MDWKLEPLLRPEWLEDREVWCIGCGALGSRYIKRLAQAGVPRIHVVDDDYIEPRNVQNTEDFARFMGERKVDAIASVVREIRPGEEVVVPHYERATRDSRFSGLVLLGLDSLKERREIAWNTLRNNPEVSFFVDGRMGATGGRAYGVDPNNFVHVDQYFSERHLPQDSADELGGCTQTPAAAATADLVASLTLWKLGRWLHLEQGCTDPYVNYIGFELVPSDFFEVESWC